MPTPASIADDRYSRSMGQLLMLYTQVDRLIMEACAERIADAPDEPTKLALAKQVGDECRHVRIQQEWMAAFGTDPTPIIDADQEQAFLDHFRSLNWPEFLSDLYVAVEALGSEAVERIVPLADPGTRESLRVPLADEADHVAFGLGRLREALADMDESERNAFVAALPARIEALTGRLHGLGLGLRELFEGVGADYETLAAELERERDVVIGELAEPRAA